MNNMKKTTKIIYFLMILFLLKPTGIDSILPNLNTVMNIFRFIAMILILLIYIQKIIKLKKVKINTHIFIIIIIELLSFISCLYNNQSPYSTIVFWQGILSLMLLAEIEEKNMLELVKILIYVLATYIIINFIYILFNYDYIKISRDFILGRKNMLILYIFPFISLILLKPNQNNKNKFIDISLIIISLITILISESSTSIVACIMLCIYYIVKNNIIVNKVLSKIKAKQIFVILMAFFIFIIIFSVQQYFSFFIVDILGKDITFTGRTYVWEKVLNLIQEKPIIGYGWNSSLDEVQGILSWEEYTTVQHAHNFILNIAYKSGIIASVFYCYFLWKISIKIDNYDEMQEKMSMKVIYVGFLVLMTFEAYPTNCIALFFICYIMLNYKLINN